MNTAISGATNVLRKYYPSYNPRLVNPKEGEVLPLYPNSSNAEIRNGWLYGDKCEIKFSALNNSGERGEVFHFSVDYNNAINGDLESKIMEIFTNAQDGRAYTVPVNVRGNLWLCHMRYVVVSGGQPIANPDFAFVVWLPEGEVPEEPGEFYTMANRDQDPDLLWSWSKLMETPNPGVAEASRKSAGRATFELDQLALMREQTEAIKGNSGGAGEIQLKTLEVLSRITERLDALEASTKKQKKETENV